MIFISHLRIPLTDSLTWVISVLLLWFEIHFSRYLSATTECSSTAQHHLNFVSWSPTVDPTYTWNNMDQFKTLDWNYLLSKKLTKFHRLVLKLDKVHDFWLLRGPGCLNIVATIFLYRLLLAALYCKWVFFFWICEKNIEWKIASLLFCQQPTLFSFFKYKKNILFRPLPPLLIRNVLTSDSIPVTHK